MFWVNYMRTRLVKCGIFLCFSGGNFIIMRERYNLCGLTNNSIMIVSAGIVGFIFIVLCSYILWLLINKHQGLRVN